ncbi:hypothetical protein H8S90_11315 [Olivibacter sp. SDN3]|uniref:hypothetical protein n=1 Tax=Olivibacter sp. SDN3 TaxID=2764720 RepID=UPI0016518D96|nr:hypothetical protein [Olivibacter sp. SDN3]QNL52109.1 hypothetical protein H8S90_11315 [Olivibacter sp. SDN3]
MKIFLQPYIQKLKDKVLEVSRIDSIIAADCYKLALDISTRTNKTISQTTIKRVYGFAQARYAPSTFTLNALSQYCGYESWADFIHVMDSKTKKDDQNITWNEIAQAAHNITRFTIQTNKHKCGISYLHTIERKSIDSHIECFLNTEATGCIISAPSGMGKTIGITHWVDKLMGANHRNETNNIILHVNSSSLFFAAGFGFHSNKWLAHLLNFPQHQHLEDFIIQHQENAPGNFYLIIDDFNNNLINNRLFDIVFRQLIDIATYFSSYPWMKIIITLRPSTWQKYGHLIENHPETNKLWFTNFPCSKRVNAINLQPFTTTEIQQLISKLCPSITEDTDYARKYFPVISVPLHFQYYYQIKGNNIGIDQLNPADEYAIASFYIRKNILKGALAAEKQIMLDQLVKIFIFNDSEDTVLINKKEAYPIIKENHSIYNDLLHGGLLYEYQKEQGTRAAYQIKFQSIPLAAYFVTQHAIEKNNNQIDTNLIIWIQEKDYPEYIKLAIIKWLIIFSLEAGDLTIFNLLQNVDFIEKYQATLILFTCSNLDYVTCVNPSIANLLNQAFANSTFIDIALDHILMETEYKLALKKLLRYNLSYQQKILLHTSLAFFELLYLQDEDALKHIDALRAIPYEHFAEFSLNPLLIIENIHHYHKHNVFKENAFEEIKLFCDYPDRNASLTHKQLIYILGYTLLKLKGDEHATFNYLNIVSEHAKDITKKITADFRANIALELAERFTMMKKLDEALKKREEALVVNNSYTLNRIQLGLLDMEMLRQEKKDYLQIAQQLILITKQFNLKYYEVNIRIYLIRTLSPKEHCGVIAENKAALQALFNNSGYKVKSFYNRFNAIFINSSTVN